MDVEYKGKDGQLPVVVISLGDDFREAAQFSLELLNEGYATVIISSSLDGEDHPKKLHSLKKGASETVDDIAYLLQSAAIGNQPA